MARIRLRELRQTSFLVQVFLSFLLVIFLLGIVNYASAYNSFRRMEELCLDQQESAFNAVGQQTADLLGKIDSAIIQYAMDDRNNLSLTRAAGKDDKSYQDIIDLQDVIKDLYGFTRLDVVIHSVYLYNLEQDYLITSDSRIFRGEEIPGTLRDSIEGHPDRQSLMIQVWDKPASGLNPYFQSDMPEQPRILYLVRMLPLFTKKQYALIFTIDTRMFFSVLGQQDLPGSGDFLLEADGRQFTPSQSDDAPLIDYRDHLYGGEGADRSDYVVFSYPLPLTDGRLCYINRLNDLFGNLSAFRILNVVWIAAMVLVTLSVALFLSRRLYRPIDSLVRSHRPPAAGEGKPVKNEFEIIGDLLSYAKSRNESMQTCLNAARECTRQFFVNSVITPSGDIALMKKTADWLECGFTGEGFLILFLCGRDGHGQGVDIRRAMDQSVLSGCEELFRSRYPLLGAAVSQGRVIVILNFPGSGGDFRRIEQDLADYLAIVNERFGAMYLAGISTMKRGYEEICKGYREAQDAVNFLMAHGAGTVGSYEGIRDSLHIEYPYSLEEKLIGAIGNGNVEETGDCLSLLEKQYLDNEGIPFSYKQFLMKNILMEAYKQAEAMAEAEQVCGIPYTLVAECGYQDAMPLLKKLCMAAAEYQRVKNEFNMSYYMVKVKQYIDEHFREELSVGLIAERFHISYAYVRRLFHERFHTGIPEYITQVRIDHAKYLLRTSNQSVSAIGRMVGFNSIHTFGRLFKRTTGMTQSDYRKMHAGGEASG